MNNAETNMDKNNIALAGQGPRKCAFETHLRLRTCTYKQECVLIGKLAWGVHFRQATWVQFCNGVLGLFVPSGLLLVPSLLFGPAFVPCLPLGIVDPLYTLASIYCKYTRSLAPWWVTRQGDLHYEYQHLYGMVYLVCLFARCWGNRGPLGFGLRWNGPESVGSKPYCPNWSQPYLTRERGFLATQTRDGG
ncbi:hypothetical protein LXG23DRAFT_38744 [Yarrowia lipolytica]|nr:hypothetical protein LXG23DRAFT_38744 [Yarrowia lipolytica]